MRMQKPVLTEREDHESLKFKRLNSLNLEFCHVFAPQNFCFMPKIIVSRLAHRVFAYLFGWFDHLLNGLTTIKYGWNQLWPWEIPIFQTCRWGTGGISNLEDPRVFFWFWKRKKHSWWLNQPKLKNPIVKLDHETPRIGVNIPKIFELPPPRKLYINFINPNQSFDISWRNIHQPHFHIWKLQTWRKNDGTKKKKKR